MAGAVIERKPPQAAVVIAGVWICLLCVPWALFLFALTLSYTPSDRPGMWTATAGFPVAVGVAVVFLVLAWRLRRPWLTLLAALLPSVVLGLLAVAVRMDV